LRAILSMNDEKHKFYIIINIRLNSEAA